MMQTTNGVLVSWSYGVGIGKYTAKRTQMTTFMSTQCGCKSKTLLWWPGGDGMQDISIMNHVVHAYENCLLILWPRSHLRKL